MLCLSAAEVQKGAQVHVRGNATNKDAMGSRLTATQNRSGSRDAIDVDTVFLCRKPCVSGRPVAVDTVYQGITRDRAGVILGVAGQGLPEHADDVRLLADRVIARQRQHLQRHQRRPVNKVCRANPPPAENKSQRLLQEIEQREAALLQWGIVLGPRPSCS